MTTPKLRRNGTLPPGAHSLFRRIRTRTSLPAPARSASRSCEDWPDVDTIVVPVGGGGLVSGIAIAVKALSAATAVAGVEVSASPPFTRSLAAGRVVSIVVQPTLADGLSGNLDPDTITFDIVRRLVDRVAVVNEDQLRQGIAGLLREERLVAEGAGATAVAAVLCGAIGCGGRRAAVIVSGANIDIETLKRLL